MRRHLTSLDYRLFLHEITSSSARKPKTLYFEILNWLEERWVSCFFLCWQLMWWNSPLVFPGFWIEWGIGNLCDQSVKIKLALAIRNGVDIFNSGTHACVSRCSTVLECCSSALFFNQVQTRTLSYNEEGTNPNAAIINTVTWTSHSEWEGRTRPNYITIPIISFTSFVSIIILL